MNFVIIVSIVIVVILNFYCVKLNYELYKSGLTNSLNRIGFKKIREASKNIKNITNKTLLRKCRFWYTFFVSTFYFMLLLIGFNIFFKTG